MKLDVHRTGDENATMPESIQSPATPEDLAGSAHDDPRSPEARGPRPGDAGRGEDSRTDLPQTPASSRSTPRTPAFSLRRGAAEHWPDGEAAQDSRAPEECSPAVPETERQPGAVTTVWFSILSTAYRRLRRDRPAPEGSR
ncbi:hypothetical protein ACF1E9_31345 [Streptomyces roseolus]|uniref:hypothetical protein n=1 Tax=Streptomyces roseolus TaxID=67358 RepID=UPI00370277A3